MVASGWPILTDRWRLSFLFNFEAALGYDGSKVERGGGIDGGSYGEP
jgi:hypothetical protein